MQLAIRKALAFRMAASVWIASAGGQPFAWQGFDVPIPQNVTWYALSDADNLNHLVDLEITDNGTTTTASANVWLCRIET